MSAVSPGLRDEEGHAVLPQRRRAVAELGGDVDLHRHPRGLLDPVARGEPGVVRGAAGDDGRPLHACEREGQRRQRHPFRARIVVGAQRVADGARLLEDLLQHVVAVVALADHRAVVRRDALRPLDGAPVRIADRDRVPAQHRPVALVEVADPPREGGERQRVRGEVGGVLGVPDGERRAPPGADEKPRVAREDDREGERPFQLGQRRGRGLLRVEAAGHVGIDQMGDHFCVGVGGELAPLRLQPRAQLAVVLDDAVVDHGDAAGGVRMRVGLARLAMRRPARVPDACRAAHRAAGDEALQLRELALGPAQLDRAVGEGREPRRIVAAVLEPPQPVQDVRRRRLAAGDADDSAHACRTPSRFA